MDIFTTAKVSPPGKLNYTDVKKIAIYTAIFFAAPSLMYLGQLQGTLVKHTLELKDFIPDKFTIGSIEGWAIGVIINFFLKLSNATQ